jgi:hypothetical protein
MIGRAQGALRAHGRLAVALLALLPTGCAIFEGPAPPNPLIGSWITTERDKVTFQPDAVIVAPDKGKPTTMGQAECNGTYKLAYGRMATAPLKQLFSSQADLTAQLKQLLVQPEYPVAEITCDRGGTTYLMLDDRQLLAIYRDGTVGGIERMTRL